MGVTYPAPPPSLSTDLTAKVVHYLLKDPTRLARRIRTLALNKYIADFLLTGVFQAVGGAILYPNGEPLFANDDPEAVGIGGEYPLTSIDDGTLAMAKTVKWGRDVEVFDESIARFLMNPVNRAMNRLVNSNIRYVDGIALGVIASKITRNHPAGAAWTSGAQIIEDVLLSVAETQELEDGFDIDTIVLKPTQYAKVRSQLIADNMLPREAGNPVENGGTGVFNYLGLDWATSIHSPVTDPLLVDRQQLGGMADEDLQSPGYASAAGQDQRARGIEVKTMRQDETDGYRLRCRRVTVPIVLEPNAGMRITGTGDLIMGYRVKAAGLVAKVESDTGEGYFYRDAILPAGVPDEELKRLEELKLIEKVEDPAPEPADDDSDDSDGDGKGDDGSSSDGSGTAGDEKKTSSTPQPAKKTASSPKS